MNTQLLKVSDVAKILNLSEDRVYTLSRERILPSVRLGRTLRFSVTAIDEFISTGGKSLTGVSKRES